MPLFNLGFLRNHHTIKFIQKKKNCQKSIKELNLESFNLPYQPSKTETETLGNICLIRIIWNELLEDDDAWLIFTFPFPFIMFRGWMLCEDLLWMWFMKEFNWRNFNGNDFRPYFRVSWWLKCVAYQTLLQLRRKNFRWNLNFESTKSLET